MACHTDRDASGTVLSITCTRGPATDRDARAVVAHLTEVGLIAEEVAPAPATEPAPPALFDL